jgi:hypothetical protein
VISPAYSSFSSSSSSIIIIFIFITIIIIIVIISLHTCLLLLKVTYPPLRKSSLPSAMYVKSFM